MVDFAGRFWKIWILKYDFTVDRECGQTKACPAVVQLLVFIYSGYSRISHEYSSLFIIVIGLIFMFSLWCIDWVGSRYENRFFMYFSIKSSIGTQGEVS